jgi:hypothetical protein
MSQHEIPPIDNAMATEVNAAFDTAVDTAFDRALRQHFQSDAEPDDDGLSQRVLAALPARAVRRHSRWVEWALHAQWAAISVAACGAAALMSISDGRVATAHHVAAYSLIGLLIFWAIPSRWSRG